MVNTDVLDKKKKKICTTTQNYYEKGSIIRSLPPVGRGPLEFEFLKTLSMSDAKSRLTLLLQGTPKLLPVELFVTTGLSRLNVLPRDECLKIKGAVLKLPCSSHQQVQPNYSYRDKLGYCRFSFHYRDYD